MPRKITQAELNQIVDEARRREALQCSSYHPVKGARCQKPKNHPGPHFYQVCPGARAWTWGGEG